VIYSARRRLEVEDKTIVEADGDSAVRMPLGCIGGRLSLCDVEDNTQMPYLPGGSVLQTGSRERRVATDLLAVAYVSFFSMLFLVGSLSSAYRLPSAIYVARKTLTLT
jgi:hypothetical protein